ncbi:MAG: hypothetical protein V2A61_03420 [Calditrichota bacterium]
MALVSALLIPAPPLIGSSTLDSPAVEEFSTIILDYSKGIELDHWQGSLKHQRQLGLNIFSLTEKLDVTRRRAPRLKDQWKTDQKARFDLRRAHWENLSWLIRGEWSDFYDQPVRLRRSVAFGNPLFPQNIDLSSRLNTTSAISGGKIQSWYCGLGGTGCAADKVKWSASIGPVYDEHYGRSQTGIKLDADLATRLGGDLRGQLWIIRRSPRQEYSGSAQYAGTTTLSDQAVNQVKIIYLQAEQREMSYRTPIQTGSRRDDQLHVLNRLQVGLEASWNLDWESEFNRQTSAHNSASEDYRDQEWSWQNHGETTWRGTSAGLKLEGGLDFQEQEYAGSVTLGRQYKVGLTADCDPAFAETLAVNLQAARYRFDTPAEDDKNDRDELRYNFELHAFHRLTPDLALIWKLESNLNHLIYIYRTRSGENRWRRFFRFSIETPWQNEVVTNRAYFSVTSNYTDYDFAPNRETLSRVYRAFTANDSLNLKITSAFSLEASFAGLIDDHGRLLWRQWIEEVSEEGAGWTAALIPTWQNRRSSIGCGWSEHRRITRLRTPAGNADPGENVFSRGPLLRLKTNPNSNLSIYFYALWLQVTDRIRGGYYMPDLRIQVNWSLN